MRYYRSQQDKRFFGYLAIFLITILIAGWFFYVKEVPRESEENFVRESVFIWCLFGEIRASNCFDADKETYIFKESPRIEGLPAVLVEDHRNVDLSVGKFASQELADFLFSLNSVLKSHSEFKNTFFVLTDDPIKGISFDIGGIGVYINKNANAERIVGVVKKLLEKLPPEKSSVLKYIDLTVEGKAYLRY